MSKNRDLANYGTAALEDASVSATGDSVVKRDASGNVSAVGVYASGNVQGQFGYSGGAPSVGNTGNYIHIGTWKNAGQSSRLQLKITGAGGFSTGQGSAGETTINLVVQNSNFVEGVFYGTTAGSYTISSVAFVVDSTDVLIYVVAGGFSSAATFAFCAGGYWQPANTNTGSTSLPAGATALNSFFAVTAGSEERMRLTSDGYLRMSANSGGIQFNGDTSASNALDDYEEGTFTPSVISGWTGVTYNNQSGTYTKVGRLVHFQISIGALPENRTANGARFDIGGLPFAKTGAGASVSVWSDMWSMGGSNNTANGLIVATTIQFYQSNYATGGELELTGTKMNSGSGNELYISGTYETT